MGIVLFLLRYIGEGYSQALEAMEESMSTVYSQLSAQRLLPFPSAGKLAAVKVEGGEEVVRAQVCEVMTDKVKVRTVLERQAQWRISIECSV